LVAAWAEVPRFARKGEDAGVPALIAVNPGEAVLRFTAFEEPFDDTFLDATPSAPAHAGSNAFQPQERARRAQPSPCEFVSRRKLASLVSTLKQGPDMLSP
jgi:hypothetical protein